MDLDELLSQELLDEIKERDFPEWIQPMKATLTDERFSKDDWIYERKLDGVRAVALIKNGDVQLYSRNKKPLNNTYPEIAYSLKDSKADFVIDGEVVSFDGDKTSFSKLQERMHIKDEEEALNSGTDVYFYIFDMLYFAKWDLRDLPVIKRKKLLKELNIFNDPIRFLQHRRGGGVEYYNEACERGWEGIIAKDGNSKYVKSRSKSWLKFKCVSEQELVIVGFTEPSGSRIGFGALLLGYYEGNKLRYAGKVGTGFNDAILEELSKEMKGLEIEGNPTEDEITESQAHFIEPKLIGEVEFTEWTNDNKLRHPSFKGLRNDKDPKKVIKEES